MLQVFFAVVALVAASIHVGFSAKRCSSAATIVGTYLIYLQFIYVGVLGLFTAYYHGFRPVEASASIGWATSPYEYEVGMTDLTVGAPGALCLEFRREFWLATAIADALWRLGDVIELAMPILILGLTFYHRRQMLDSSNGRPLLAPSG